MRRFIHNDSATKSHHPRGPLYVSMSGLQREVGRSNGGLGSVSVGRHLGVTYIVTPVDRCRGVTPATKNPGHSLSPFHQHANTHTKQVYATAENVLVLNADCELVQVLRHPNHAKQRGISVRCVDMCSATGRVRAAPDGI